MDIFFDDSEFKRLYGCDNLTADEWTTQGNPNRLAAELYVSLGALYLMTSLPVLFVIFQPKFFAMACYKLFFFSGLLDVFEVVIICVIAAVFQWKGFVFCSEPILSYNLGTIATGIWAASGLCCVLLGFQRLVALKKDWKLFEGAKIYFWLLLPLTIGLGFWGFVKPLLFTSHHYSFVQNPYFAETEEWNAEEQETDLYEDMNFNVFNLTLAVVLTVQLIALIGTLANTNSTKISGKEIAASYEAVAKIFVKLIPAVLFVAVSFFKTNSEIVLAGQLAWQAAHGLSGIIHLALSKRIRNDVFYVFGLQSIEMKHGGSTANLNQNDLEGVPAKKVWEPPAISAVSMRI
ncbi:hypothetical protein L596_019295 [Steinernema carpocapsae]|uniref:7TM GPCR serpentine receptor class x (Srx) domain-containing protein n=1 Tax=Steinernema carpocapsae TaxID=34508 RepID=A0A4U5MQ09_STECR|nr:hypothetical protein L596_019295 [Steinernema carpocapsae]